MKTKIRPQTLWLFALLGTILLMTIGYASINSITGEIEGTVIAEAQQGVFITNVEKVSDIEATEEVKNYIGTTLNSIVELSSTDATSELKYKVTVYNNSEKSYPFLAVLYNEEFYDNPNIIFEISEEGYKIGDVINPNETKDIYITFKYKERNNTTQNKFKLIFGF